MADKFRIEWTAGATCEIEVISPQSSKDPFRIRYTPPFRSTLRPPVAPQKVGKKQIKRTEQQLAELAGKLTGGRAGAAGGQNGGRAAAAPGADEVDQDLAMLGSQLFRLVIPKQVQADLKHGGLFLEFGADEDLLSFPWELMYDGNDFLCLRHSMGRFVSDIPRDSIPSNKPRKRILRSTLEELSVLLISVPTPQPRKDEPDRKFDTLREAEAECTDLYKLLEGLGVEVEVLPNATYNNVFKMLEKKRFDIVHYSGHASFDLAEPQGSALVLKDEDMSSGEVAEYFGINPPVLCFINACEATKMAETDEATDEQHGEGVAAWNRTYNIFGLARGFLETGAYLLGSRWRVGDDAASVFAQRFYERLLGKGLPIGTSIREARRTCKKETADPFAWASYVFYGDPRLCFRKRTTGA